jgi:hypothetical protein
MCYNKGELKSCRFIAISSHLISTATLAFGLSDLEWAQEQGLAGLIDSSCVAFSPVWPTTVGDNSVWSNNQSVIFAQRPAVLPARW